MIETPNVGDIVAYVFGQPGNDTTHLLVEEIHGSQLKCWDLAFNFDVMVSVSDVWNAQERFLSTGELERYEQRTKSKTLPSNVIRDARCTWLGCERPQHVDPHPDPKKERKFMLPPQCAEAKLCKHHKNLLVEIHAKGDVRKMLIAWQNAIGIDASNAVVPQ